MCDGSKEWRINVAAMEEGQIVMQDGFLKVHGHGCCTKLEIEAVEVDGRD